MSRDSETEGLLGLSIAEVARMVRRRELSPVEIVDACLAAAETRGRDLNCFISVMAEGARRQARAAQEALARSGPLSELHGIPISIKDNIAVAGVAMTAGSPIRLREVPTRDAAVVTRLKRAGAVIFAKDNMYDFGYCAPNAHFGPTHNPWDTQRSCAGSSSGSAAAVAARISYASIGSDGGGSIRMPAALCGVTGVKTTLGLISRVGELPMHPTLTTQGPITRSAEDAAIVLRHVAGPDPADVETVHQPQLDFLSALSSGLRGIRIGMLTLDHGGLDEEVRGLVAGAYQALADQGASMEEVQPPDLDLARRMMWVISGSEAAEHLHEHIVAHPDQIHPFTLSLLIRSSMIPASLYLRAQRVRRALTAQFHQLLDGLDALVLPATPIPAYRIGQERVQVGEVDDHPLNLCTRYTTLFNLTGSPAVTVPCGFNSQGLPVGMQVAGRNFSEPLLMRIAHAYEQATAWRATPPPVLLERL